MQRQRPWQWLERVPGLSAARADWALLLSGQAKELQAYLRPTSRLAESLCCPDCAQEDCRRRVICHGRNDFVAIGEACGCRLPVAKQDVVVHEVDMPQLVAELIPPLRLTAAFERCQGYYQTWRMGFCANARGGHQPLYLTIQDTAEDLVTTATRLAADTQGDFRLILPTTRLLCESNRRAIHRLCEGWMTLEQTVMRQSEGGWAVSQEWDAQNEDRSSSRANPKTHPGGSPMSTSTLSRVEREDAVHWFVNGVDRGVFYRQANAKKAKIIEILFDQLGHGWIPHPTFIHACGWEDRHYWGSSSEGSVMQKQLTGIRNFLGLEVEFNRKLGVKFAGNIVKSRT